MESNINKLKKLFGIESQIEKTVEEDIINITDSSYDDHIDSMINAVSSTTSAVGSYTTTSSTVNPWVTTTGGAGGSYIINTGLTSGTYTLPSSGYFTGSYIYTNPPKTSIVAFNDPSGKEIVRINLDGSVTWAEGYNEDEAAQALSKSFTLSAELQAGLTKAVKLRMRDSVFEDLINIARDKGSLTAEDLTYLLEASKIVEKLKGAKD